MGQAVDVICAECHGTFRYVKRSNVTRKYCNTCAASRIQASKARSLLAQREERKHEQVCGREAREHSDFVINPFQLLDRVGRDLT